MRKHLTALTLGMIAWIATASPATAQFNRPPGGFTFERPFDIEAIIARFQPAGPASGIDPVIVRLNGCDAITGDLVPYRVQQEGLGQIELDRINLLNTSASLSIDFGDTFGSWFESMGTFNAGVSFRTFLPGVSIDIPVGSDSITATFRDAPNNAGRIRADIAIPDATLTTTLSVRTSLNVTIPRWVPRWMRRTIRNLTRVSDDFPITVTGVSIQMEALLERQDDGIFIDELESFTTQVDAVSVTDSAGLVAVADAFAVAIDRIFNVPGAGSVNEAATTLTNDILRDNNDLTAMFEQALNDALTAQAQVQGYSGTLPNLDPIPLDVSYELSTFRTEFNRLTAQWDVTVEASDPATNSDVEYTYLTRPTGNVALTPEEGDLQAFLPLSLFDKTAYELDRQGLLDTQMTAPATTLTSSFNLDLNLNDVPRAVAVEGASDQIKIEWPVDITTASGSISSPTFGSAQLNNVSATLELYTTIEVDDRDGLVMTLTDVALADLSGTVSLGRLSLPVSLFASELEAAVSDGLADAMTSTTLVPKVTSVFGPFSVVIDSVSVGARYVNVALSLTD